ncbi:MAG: hypothetical protein KF796_14115 [Ramlibacter sp.]|nr:hypothetical protein [Ramlibacter sp.]
MFFKKFLIAPGETDLLVIRSTIKRLRIVAGISVAAAVLSVLGLVVVLLTKPHVPELLSAAQLPAGRHRIDVVLIDMPKVTNFDIDVMVQPMLMVVVRRLPGQSQHLRLLVNARGLPWPYVGSGTGAAGYVAEENLFLVDVQAVNENWPGLRLNKFQRWAFAMAHEATHLWQRKRGALPDGSSRLFDQNAYKRDPNEIEAYREGLAVANAFPGQPFSYRFGEEQIDAPNPNPYDPLLLLDVRSRADVHVHSQTTPLGMLRSLIDPLPSGQAAIR